MAKQSDTAPAENLNDLLMRHREDLGARSMEITNQLEPLYEQRHKLFEEAEKLRMQARELTQREIRPLEDQLTPIRVDHARVARVLGGKGLGDNPA